MEGSRASAGAVMRDLPGRWWELDLEMRGSVSWGLEGLVDVVGWGLELEDMIFGGLGLGMWFDEERKGMVFD